MYTYRYHRMTFNNHADQLIGEAQAIFESGDYLAVFGWLQWVLRHGPPSYQFAKKIDDALRFGCAAYRVLDGKTIVPIASEAELETLKRAFADLATTEFHGARAHLKNAAAELTEGRIADSIRESINAVESVVRVLEPDGKIFKCNR
jgi:hypothetical protein